MELDAAKSIVRQAVEMRVPEIAISGGEPLLWPGIEDLLRLCCSHATRTSVYTSGIIAHPEETMKRLRVLGIHRIIFSLHGSEPRTHDQITQKEGSWEQTLAVVKLARAEGLAVEFHFVPMRLNYTCLPDLAVCAADLGVRQISVLRLVPHGRARCNETLLLSNSENHQLRDIIERTRRQCRIRLGSPYSFFCTSDSPNCMAGVDRLTIGPDLQIYPCDAFKRIEAARIVGTSDFSCLEGWPLSECWLRSPYLGAIRSHLKDPFNPPCSDCTHLPECRSGCPAQKYLANGEFSRVPDPMCLQIGNQRGRR